MEKHGVLLDNKTWWWNEKVTALFKEKQRLFKLWKRHEKCKKMSDVDVDVRCRWVRCRTTGG